MYNLKKIRKENNLPIFKLAQLLNVKNQDVSAWENGLYLPSIEILVSLSNIYNIPLSELLKNDEKTTMKKNIVIISSSPRQNGNTEKLIEYFEKGAKEIGHTVQKITLREMEIKFCKGCFFCQKNNLCIIDDDMKDILEIVQNANVICFATPIYYYSMSGQLKTFIDRLNPLFKRNNLFKDIYLLSAADDSNNSTFDGAITEIKNWLKCYPIAKFKGGVYCGGVEYIGDILKKPESLADAYNLGKNI